MQLKASGDNVQKSRLVIWLLLLILLVMSFLFAWQAVEQQASKSALQLANQRINERASYYKQQWLLAKQPTSLKIGSQRLNYTNTGWITPLNHQSQVDCKYWLEILYPETELLGSQPLEVTNESIAGDYRCLYNYNQNGFISISLIDNNFSAIVGFLI